MNYANTQTSKLFENQLLTYKQAASYLGISVSYLRELKSKKKVSFVFVGHRAVRFRVASLDSFVRQREVTNERSKV